MVQEIKELRTFEEAIISDEGSTFYERFLNHYVRLGTWSATEAHMCVKRGSFEIYLADNKEFSTKVHKDLLDCGCQLAVQSLPSAVRSLTSIMAAANEDPKYTLQAISSLTQIITKLQVGDKSKTDEDDIDKLYRSMPSGKPK